GARAPAGAREDAWAGGAKGYQPFSKKQLCLQIAAFSCWTARAAPYYGARARSDGLTGSLDLAFSWSRTLRPTTALPFVGPMVIGALILVVLAVAAAALLLPRLLRGELGALRAQAASELTARNADVDRRLKAGVETMDRRPSEPDPQGRPPRPGAHPPPTPNHPPPRRTAYPHR